MFEQILHWNAQKSEYTLTARQELLDNKRFQRAEAIAATPEAIQNVARSLWRVTSQSNPDQEYIVTTMQEQIPTCTCKDYERGHLCKHIMAVEIHAIARVMVRMHCEDKSISVHLYVQELTQMLTTAAITAAQSNAMMTLYAAALNLDRKPRRAEQQKVLTFQLRYWWPDYNPEDLLDVTVAPTMDDQAADLEVWSPSQGWRKPNDSLDAIRDYIEEKGLQVGPAEIETNRRNGRWEGLYRIPLYQVIGETA